MSPFILAVDVLGLTEGACQSSLQSDRRSGILGLVIAFTIYSIHCFSRALIKLLGDCKVGKWLEKIIFL